jgi:hypothetical protein
MDGSLRLLRIMQRAFLAMIVVYAVVGERLGREPKDLRQIQLVLIVLAAAEVAAILLFRRLLVQRSEEALRLRPEDVGALFLWRLWNIGSFAIALSVALYGFVFRFMGGTLLQALPFYAAAAGLMVAFTPRRPE